jgi:uncharacterized Zn finger protein (UPF0148 family)
MRLTNINCPQCGGQLNQQEDKFYCTSCGSAFNIDYDEADVEYAKLITEPERAKLLLEKDRILLDKNEQLRRRFAIGEIKREFANSARTAGMTYLSSAIYAAIIGGMSFLACVIIVGVIFFNSCSNIRNDRTKEELARQERSVRLSAEDIENDMNFLENAIAGGVAYEMHLRDEPVKNKEDDRGDAYVSGSPEAVSFRLIKNGKENGFCIVYKITYEFSEDRSTKEVYDCIIWEKIEQDENGHITFGRDCDRMSGSGIDKHWKGYENADGVFDDNAFPDDFKIYEVNY